MQAVTTLVAGESPIEPALYAVAHAVVVRPVGIYERPHAASDYSCQILSASSDFFLQLSAGHRRQVAMRSAVRSEFDTLSRPMCNLLCAHRREGGGVLSLTGAAGASNLPSNDVDRGAEAVAPQDREGVVGNVFVRAIKGQGHRFARQRFVFDAPG